MAAIDEVVLALVREHMHSDAKIASHHDRVYKDECMLCFATSESPGGLYINLRTFQAFDEQHVDLDQERTGAVLYLQETATRVALPESEQEARPDKLAIGVAGGFKPAAPKHRVEKAYALVLMPARLSVPLPCPGLPQLVLDSIASVQAHDSAAAQDVVASWQEERRVSKYAEGLEQLPASRKVPMDPKQWRCDDTGVTENLWLNLSTGHIGSGRQHWDGTGGNGAAERHFQATGSKYPLVVKLGTITPSGADVYSYAPDEDDMVTDPLLAQHLAHWGINMLQMEKTEKSMAELQVEKNLEFELNAITEAGTQLQPLSGPGHVGLVNLGNSCYMASVLQLLWALPELTERYVRPADGIFRSAPADLAGDLPTQLAKVGVALVTGKTGAPSLLASDAQDYEAVTVSTEQGLEAVAQGHKGATGEAGRHAVRPLAFKALVGRGHAEFSSARQQDAEEYFGHLLSLLDRGERGAAERLPRGAAQPTSLLFRFGLEERVQCSESGRVSYNRSSSTTLGLPIPLDAASNAAELAEHAERQQKRARLREGAADDADQAANGTQDEERPLPRVPLAACLARFAAESHVDDYYSAALGRKTKAIQRARLSSFPPYLLVQLHRYYVADDWTPRKMEVLVDMPESLNLEELRGAGPQTGEELQPDEPTPAAAGSGSGGDGNRPEPDRQIVEQLMGMGFSEAGSCRAALAVANAGPEAAMEWVFAHMGDADFNDPLPEPGQEAGGSQGAADVPSFPVEALSMLTGMGFTDRQATGALTACGGSMERAADWLFSHMDGLDAAVESALAPPDGGAAGGSTTVTGPDSSGAPVPELLDGRPEYELVGFVSHMGANTACGHYVAHIKKEGRWVIYNDEKVAASERPPLDLGYLYLYRRKQ